MQSIPWKSGEMAPQRHGNLNVVKAELLSTGIFHTTYFV
jgi:hypothetical protein